MNKKINLVLLFGGKSVESDISIISAMYVYNLIKDDNRYNIILIYADENNNFYTSKKFYEMFKKEKNIKRVLLKSAKIGITKIGDKVILKSSEKSLNGLKIDLIYPIMHGEGLEDGVIAGYLKFLDIASPIPNVLEAAMFQDKYITKLLLKELNINTLPYQVITNTNQKINIKLPIIIKPLSLGSSIGINVVASEDELNSKLQSSFKYSNSLLIEPLLENFKEYSIAIYQYRDDIYLSNVEKSITNNQFYTFEEKYLREKRTQTILDLSIDRIEEIKQITSTIYTHYFKQGIIRIDFLYDQINEKIYVCEVNTIPGNLSLNMFKNSKYNIKEVIYQNILQAIWINNQTKKNIMQVFKSNVLSNTKFASKK